MLERGQVGQEHSDGVGVKLGRCRWMGLVLTIVYVAR